MAGHSKWANIKHRKSAQDSKRSKNFQKISKEIQIAIKDGGSKVETNYKLRIAIAHAKSLNVPNENIKRVLDKSEKDISKINKVTYEGYGPKGIAIIVECLTDNVNRTAAFVKSVFNKYDGKLGITGSVSYSFKPKGLIVFEKKSNNIDELFELLIEYDILELKEEDDHIIIETNPSKLFQVKKVLNDNGINKFDVVELIRDSVSKVKLSDNDNLKVLNMINTFEESDDIIEIFTNVE